MSPTCWRYKGNIVTMTDWLPGPEWERGQTAYVAIADAVAADVARGRLLPGDRLPTHRMLARRLGVTIGTVTRAYAEAGRRGLVRGEVGRGTYVLGLRADDPDIALAVPASPPAEVDLSRNLALPASTPPELLRAIAEAWRGVEPSALLDYQAKAGNRQDREAGVHWLPPGLRGDPDRVVLTAGAQHAIVSALATVTTPGDVVVAESMSYPGLRTAADHVGVRLVGLPMDGEGLVPDALAAACGRLRPRALYCTPTLQNPTGAVLSAPRRSEIAAVAARHGVVVIEDDTYGFLAPDAPPPLTADLGPLGVYVTTLSKSVLAGLRIGYLVTEPQLATRIASTVMSTVWMAPPAMARLATRLIETGTATAVADWKRAEGRRRLALAHATLPTLAPPGAESSLHCWLPLPPPWRGVAYTAASLARGVLVTSGEEFAVDWGQAVPQGVRLCIGTPADTVGLRSALQALRSVLDGPPAAVH